MKLKNVLKLTAILMSCVTASNVAASPNTVSAEIVLIRPYSNGTVFVQLASSQLATGVSCTSVYSVRSELDGAKNVTATLLTAYALGNNVEIELPTATGCEGFGTPIQSVYLR